MNNRRMTLGLTATAITLAAVAMTSTGCASRLEPKWDLPPEPGKKLPPEPGYLSEREVHDVIKEHVREIQACYERLLSRDAGAQGELWFTWRISPKGRVTEAHVLDGSLREAEFSGCVQQIIEAMKFPRPRGGAFVVEYPFAFSVCYDLDSCEGKRDWPPAPFPVR